MIWKLDIVVGVDPAGASKYCEDPERNFYMSRRKEALEFT